MMNETYEVIVHCSFFGGFGHENKFVEMWKIVGFEFDKKDGKRWVKAIKLCRENKKCTSWSSLKR